MGNGLPLKPVRPSEIPTEPKSAERRQEPPSGASEEEAGPKAIDELTDLGNARRFAKRFGREIFFLADQKVWLAWNGNRFDSSRALVKTRASSLSEVLFSEYVETATYTSLRGHPIEDSAVLAHARSFEQNGAVTRMLSMAETVPELIASTEDFDVDPFELNCPNGVVDLKTGKVRPNSPAWKLTKLAGADYDPNMKAPRWREFLRSVTSGKPELEDYLQRVAGYCLTGSTDEQCMFVLYGTGANGKSTFIDLCLQAAGTYGQAASVNILAKDNRAAIRCDVARLQGARLVTAVEPNHGAKMNEALVKQLTGGDRIAARMLYRNEVEFTPRMKLMVATNHLPRIDGVDDGIWRRIKLIPFKAKFQGKKDAKDLKTNLRAELPGILAWMVEGAKQWYKDGLREPKLVSDMTASYRESMDHIQDFLDHAYEPDPREKVTVKAINDAYKNWVNVAGVEPVSRESFPDLMRAKGFEQGKSGDVRYWMGLRLKIATAPASQAQTITQTTNPKSDQEDSASAA